MGLRVTAFSRDTSPKAVEDVKKLGAWAVANSSDKDIGDRFCRKFSAVITTVPSFRHKS